MPVAGSVSKLVDGNIYVTGGSNTRSRELKSSSKRIMVFDTEAQTWEVRKRPDWKVGQRWLSSMERACKILKLWLKIMLKPILKLWLKILLMMVMMMRMTTTPQWTLSSTLVQITAKIQITAKRKKIWIPFLPKAFNSCTIPNAVFVCLNSTQMENRWQISLAITRSILVV
ncbi:Kelch-type beta propeller [Arabidopsis thaliana x Arabidopsis arenosa]|uniref:Kelch-type beta propeller n=1 Tax=Arabidopsis thaliana x Arabidopsis arenosa TaxID=1240361 RepID=A0A8T2AY31_9BRAS|nr:Kelch-type beta propeller [Arabidopsis thaliana x Arabidopsis arenosa]